AALLRREVAHRHLGACAVAVALGADAHQQLAVLGAPEHARALAAEQILRAEQDLARALVVGLEIEDFTGDARRVLPQLVLERLLRFAQRLLDRRLSALLRDVLLPLVALRGRRCGHRARGFGLLRGAFGRRR